MMLMRFFCFFLYQLLLLCAATITVAAQEQHIMEFLQEKKANNELQVKLTPEQQKFKQQYDTEFAKFRTQYLREFAEFKARYNEQLSAYRQGLISDWGEADTSDAHKVVSYPEDDVKAIVDYDSEQIVISVLHAKDTPASIEKAAQALSDLQDTQIQPIDTGESGQPSINALKNLSDDASVQAVLRNPQKAIPRGRLGQAQSWRPPWWTL